jgi:hypothetical protein
MVLRVRSEYLMKSNQRILFCPTDIQGALGKALVTHRKTLPVLILLERLW